MLNQDRYKNRGHYTFMAIQVSNSLQATGSAGIGQAEGNTSIEQYRHKVLQA